ncbi:hypothetical protein SMMN14_01755 [Sphaerulina musiva]
MTSPTPPNQNQPCCHLFRLPLELRQHIYSFLLPAETNFTPIPAAGINSVNYRPPSLSLLTIHPTITAEILNDFYSLSTWKIVCGHSYNYFRIDPELMHLERSRCLARMEKVEMMFFVDGEFILDYPSFGIPRLCTEIAKRAHRACQVLLQAPELRIIVVSWWDTTTTTTTTTSAAKADSRGCGGGEEWRSEVLAPLRILVDGKEKEKEKNSDSYSKRRLRFEVGSVNAAEEFGREEFADALRGVIGEGMVEVRNSGK